MSSSRSQLRHEKFSIFTLSEWTLPLVVLVLFLGVVFLTGGSSRADVPKLIFLRPIAILVAGFGLATIRREHVTAYWQIWAVFLAAALLTVLHLVPLPPGVWQSLPGRDIIVEIDALAATEGNWRPLSMYPEGTWNALYALSVPFAALLLASQLDQKGQVRLLVAVILLAMLSGLLGVMQSAGTDMAFYPITTKTAGLFANRNHQAALLACLFPMLAALAASADRFGTDPRATRLIAAAGMVALAPLIVVTGSRMGLIVGAIAFLSLAFMRIGGDKRRKASGFGNLIQKAAIGVIATGMVLGTVFLARDEALDRVGGLNQEPRLPVWQSIVDFLPTYMPWGSGIGSFAPVYQIHEDARLLGPQYFNQAHNDWLDLVMTAGLPGVLLAAIAIMMFFRAARASMNVRGISGHLRRAGLIVILILAFASVSDYPIRTPILSALFAVAAIWAWSPPSQSTVEESKAKHA